MRQNGAPDDGRQSPLVRLLVRTTLMLALLTVAYFVVPLRAADRHVGARVVVGVAVAVCVAVVLRAQARVARQVAVRPFAAIEALLTGLYLIVLLFAAGYFVLAAVPGGFEGLENRIDALYFSLAVVTTVGFGDVHASAPVTRAVVSVHMLFNLFFIGTAVRLLGRTAGHRDPG